MSTSTAEHEQNLKLDDDDLEYFASKSLSGVLAKYDINNDSIISIPQFKPEPHPIEENSPEFKLCIDDKKYGKTSRAKEWLKILCNVKVHAIKSGSPTRHSVEYVYGIVTTVTDWYFILYSTEGIYCTSKTEYRISLTEDAIKNPTELRKNVKRVLEVIVATSRRHVPRAKSHIFSEANPEMMRQRIEELEVANTQARQEHAELLKRIIKLEQAWTEREPKKNRKFQTRCIQIAKEVLNEQPVVEYRPSFMQGLELDAFFQKYRIALEVQGAHSTSWYKDVKKLEDIVNRDRQKRCICQDNGISLLEVWYDEKPEIVIPKKMQKIRVTLSSI
ncbi:hypothetical protein GLOIN_2v229933 [Rhizophagus clarus]|uniref:Uncharacterized protein n=1 Tax=Rhizophagus clarus TaxID=94130 RepID=A0A8H3QZK8_9GLOM|nr:hypothetical protein GLOIN_2v229933 [Rhizophagus clarus]